MTIIPRIDAANHVRRGPVAIVGPSGTGIREVATLLHHYGSGVSLSFGTDGHDLHDAAGAEATLAALDQVAGDDGTEIIVLVSRQPSPAAAARVLDRAVATGRRVVAAFLGYAAPTRHGGVVFVSTLEDAARSAAVMSGAGLTSDHPTLRVIIPRFTREQHWLRGLYSGGTLAYEALTLLAPSARIASNLKFLGAAPFGAITAPTNTLVDLGDDELRHGRAHPRIDLGSRIEAIRAVASDPSASVLLLDVVLGSDAHPDPATALAPEIVAARDAAAARGGTLVVIGSVTGTDDDPQRRSRQVEALFKAGVEVCSSNAAAVRRARVIVTGEWP